MAIARVWIEEGCIQCHWCQNLLPDVFNIAADGCRIRAEVRVDRRTNANRRERSRLRPRALANDDHAMLQFAADGCPVQVIKLDGAVSLLR